MKIRSITRVRLMAALACAPLCMSLAACSHTQSAESASPLRIFGMRSTIERGPVNLAADSFYPGKLPVGHGGIPNLFAAPGSQPPLEPADVATHAETQALRNSLTHPDVRIILTVAEGHYRLLGRRSAGIATLADLRGKRIATIEDTSAAFHLHKMLRLAGLTEADVTIVSFPRPTGISQAIIDRSVDVLAMWEPEMQSAVEALGEDAILFEQDPGYREIFNLNTTAGKLADPVKRRQIVAFVAATIRASRALAVDPAPGIRLVADASGYDPALVERSWRHHTFPGKISGDLLDILVEEEAWMAQRGGRSPRSRADLATLIDGSVTAEALALIDR
jgi:NitT/TauT family transport system substrate-binding protein